MRDPARAVFFRPRLGKTRTVVDAARELWLRDDIDALVAVAPAEARSVWADPSPMLGEIAKWWPGDVPLPGLTEYRAKTNLSALGKGKGRQPLVALVTNPEFVRRPDRLGPLLEWMKTRRVLLAWDESWSISNATSQQSKAAAVLGTAAVRRAVLNGTPGTMAQAYGQYRLLDPTLFGVKNWWAYRARFCRLGGYMQKEIVGYQNEDLFQRLTAPLTTYLKREDVFEDLPPSRIQIEVPLTPPTWRLYQEMKRDLIAWLSANESAVAAHAGAKVMRLAQITSGIVGGVELSPQGDVLEIPEARSTEKIIGREKIDGLLGWLSQEGMPDKLVVFARFKPDVARLAVTLAEAYPAHWVGRMYSDASKDEKRRLKELFVADGDPAKAIAVVNAQSGGAGLSLAQSNLAVFMGHEYSQRLRDQAEQRIADHQQLTYLDILATGPKGERTVDHLILAAQRGQEETASWTAAMWRDRLTADDPIL